MVGLGVYSQRLTLNFNRFAERRAGPLLPQWVSWSLLVDSNWWESLLWEKLRRLHQVLLEVLISLSDLQALRYRKSALQCWIVSIPCSWLKVTACVMPSWHLSGLVGVVASNHMWSDEWRDFRGQGQTRHKSDIADICHHRHHRRCCAFLKLVRILAKKTQLLARFCYFVANSHLFGAP